MGVEIDLSLYKEFVRIIDTTELSLFYQALSKGLTSDRDFKESTKFCLWKASLIFHMGWIFASVNLDNALLRNYNVITKEVA